MGIFNERLRELRDSSGISSKKLAEDLNIKEARLSYYMSNDREPPFELLIAFADYFNVSTDYLTGKSLHKNHEEEFLAKNVTDKLENSGINPERQGDIEAHTIGLHDLLVKFSEIEMQGKNSGNVWEQAKYWLKGLSQYLVFVTDYRPQNYPLDSAREAMNLFTKSRYFAMKNIINMCEQAYNDESIDERIKSRIQISTSYNIRPSRDEQPEHKNYNESVSDPK